MKERDKIDAIQMTRAIREELYKSYQASPEEYYSRLHERFLKLQEVFGKRVNS